jgi:hypothetical protein
MIVWWILPSMLTFLCLCQLSRLELINIGVPEDWDAEVWKAVLICSIVWPFGVLVILIMYAGPVFKFLVKER